MLTEWCIAEEPMETVVETLKMFKTISDGVAGAFSDT
jgi:hypothetical protein